MGRLLYWIAYGLLFLWQIPQNIVALCMMPFLGKLTKIRSTKWSAAYMGGNMQGGISLGCFCFLSPRLSMRDSAVRHELDGHTWDSRIFGPLYLLIIGLPSLLNAWIGFTPCYYDFPTERLANRHAGLGVDENCRLYIPIEPAGAEGAEGHDFPDGQQGLKGAEKPMTDGAVPMGLKNNPDSRG